MNSSCSSLDCVLSHWANFQHFGSYDVIALYKSVYYYYYYYYYYFPVHRLRRFSCVYVSVFLYFVFIFFIRHIVLLYHSGMDLVRLKPNC